MTPNKPRRTPRIATGNDLSYTCTNDACEFDVLDRDSNLDDHTWTCTACGEPVLIEMDDRAGGSTHVRRYQAQEVEAGQMVYLDNDLSASYLVKGSSPGTGKKNGGKVMLGLAKLTGVYFVPDQYFNCVP